MSSNSEITTPVVDAAREELLVAINSSLGDAVVDSHLKPGDDIWIRVRNDAWQTSIKKLRDLNSFDYFCFLSAIDWMPTISRSSI